MKRLSGTDQIKLEKLAHELKRLLENHEAVKTAAKRKCDEAVAEALLIGRALNDINNIIRDEDLASFLESKRLKISPQTLREYPRLAQSDFDSFLQQALLRQAYIAIGLFGPFNQSH